MSKVQLNCVIHGKTPACKHIFSINIARSETAGMLKNLIKENNEKELGEFDAANLTLWGVSIPCKEVTDNVLELLEFKDDAKAIQKLFPLRCLSSYFTENPNNQHLHVIVESPSAIFTGKLLSIAVSLISMS